jgi:hypothetical protein
MRPRKASLPQHKWKNPNKLGPFMQQGTGVCWGADAVIGQWPRHYVDPTSKPIIRGQECQQPRLSAPPFCSYPRHVAAVPGCTADWQLASNKAHVAPRSRSAAAFACESRLTLTLQAPLGRTDGRVMTRGGVGELEMLAASALANQAAGQMCGLVKQLMT